MKLKISKKVSFDSKIKLMIISFFYFCYDSNAQMIFKLDYINNSSSVLVKNKVLILNVSPDSTGMDCPYDRMSFDTMGRVSTYAVGSSDETEVIHYTETGKIKSISYKVYMDEDQDELLVSKDTFIYKKGKLAKVYRYEFDSVKVSKGNIQFLLNYEHRIQLLNLVKDSLLRSFESSKFSRPCHNTIYGQLKFIYHYLPNGLIEKIVIVNEHETELKTLYFIYQFRD